MKPKIILIAYALYVLFGMYFFQFIVPPESHLFIPVLVVFGIGAGLLSEFALRCFEKKK